MVPVEAGVHAAELRQAHRHVAVVEDDRDAEALAQGRRDAAQVRHRHREDDDRVRPLALDEPVEVLLPARRHPAPDHLARHPVAEAVLRIVLGAAQVRVALEPRDEVARAGERLALAVGRVRRGAPPRRLDRPAAVRRDDEVDALLVQPLPELPPGGRAAVAEVEVDGGGDGEDLGRAHAGSVAEGGYGAVKRLKTLTSSRHRWCLGPVLRHAVAPHRSWGAPDDVQQTADVRTVRDTPVVSRANQVRSHELNLVRFVEPGSRVAAPSTPRAARRPRRAS